MTVRAARRRSARAALRQHPVAFGGALAGVLVALTIVAALSTNGIPFLSRYELKTTLPRDAAPVRVGDEVRVAGLVTGLVEDVTPTASGQRVVFSLGGAAEPVGRDVTLTVRLRSPAGQHYLAVERGSFIRDPLPSGAVIPPSQVHRTDDLLNVIQGFDRTALANLATTTRFTGYGLAGRGVPLNTSLAGLDRTTQRLTGILAAATPGDDATGFLRAADLTARGLGGQLPTDPGRLTTDAARTFDAFAAERDAIGAALQALRPAEDELLATLPTADTTLGAAAVLARQLTPAAAALRQALPDLAALLGQGQILRQESARLAAAALPPLSRLVRPLRAFAPSAKLIGLAVAPLGPLARYLAQYGPELESGFAAFYAANNYLNTAGQARNTPAAPAMLILTCATGSDTDPRPGQLFRDQLAKPCV